MTDEQKYDLLLEKIPNIAIDYCIENYTGSLDFYLEMLSDWSNSDHLDNMQKALSEGDFATYRIEAHSLKGLSRSVGLDDIAKLAEELQFACDRDDVDFVKAKHADYSASIEATTATISDILNN